jgi:hypothetical protein
LLIWQLELPTFSMTWNGLVSMRHTASSSKRRRQRKIGARPSKDLTDGKLPTGPQQLLAIPRDPEHPLHSKALYIVKLFNETTSVFKALER